MSNLTDSTQLDELRSLYRRERRDHATAARLGAYAAHRGILIDNFGDHSTRWITHFIKGRDKASKYPPLFIP